MQIDRIPATSSLTCLRAPIENLDGVGDDDDDDAIDAIEAVIMTSIDHPTRYDTVINKEHEC